MGKSEVVVIGYGSDLRSDDGVGRRAAELVDELALPGVSTHSVQQLVPELVVPLSRARLAIFVDAFRGTDADDVRVERLSSSHATNWSDHVDHPEALVALAQALYGARPEAWWVLVPGTNFEFGMSLSEKTAHALKEAVEQIRELVAGRQPNESMVASHA